MASEHLKCTLKLLSKVPRIPCSISLKTEELNLHRKYGLDFTMGALTCIKSRITHLSCTCYDSFSTYVGTPMSSPWQPRRKSADAVPPPPKKKSQMEDFRPSKPSKPLETMLTDVSRSALVCSPELWYTCTRVCRLGLLIHAKPLGFIDMAMHLCVCSYINGLFNGGYKTQSRFMAPWGCTGVHLHHSLFRNA